MIGLQLLITPTARHASLDGVRCRAWDGLTPLGSRCVVYVQWIAVPHGQDTREFDAIGLEDSVPPAIEPDDAGTPGLAGAATPITPSGNPARGGRRDEEEDDEGKK